MNILKCARSACSISIPELDGRVKIRNDSGGGFRTYCLHCAKKIINPNQKYDDLKLEFQVILPQNEGQIEQVTKWLKR